MFSKPLFKQSCKANLGLWSFVTVITCIILAVLVLVIGNLNVGTVSKSMVDLFVKDSVEASVKKQSLTYFNMTDEALINFDENTKNLDILLNSSLSTQQKNMIISQYNNLINQGKSEQEAKEMILSSLQGQTKLAVGSFLDYYIIMQDDYSSNAINEYVLRIIEEEIYQQILASGGQEMAIIAKGFIHQAVNDYIIYSSNNSSDISNQTPASPTTFATTYIPNVLKGIFITQQFENQGQIIKVSDYFTEDQICDTSLTVILSFRAQVEYKRAELKATVKQQNPQLSDKELEMIVNVNLMEYKNNYISTLSGSLLEGLPEEVSTSLQELGNMDMGELVIGSMFFKMAGILLPIVYVIMASNNLIASQVDSGSMAFILSTPTKRTTISFTQMAYLIFSLFAMFLCTTIVGLICLAIAGSSISITYSQMILLNLGAFVTMFAISGICFLTSSWFNRSKLAMSIGGGLSMFFFVATILGLFGSPTIPNMMRVGAMDFFNYLSIITLFDCLSILAGTTAFIWKGAILLAVGIVCYIVSIFKFKKKDLPL